MAPRAASGLDAERADAGGEQRGAETERCAAEDGADDEPGRRRRVAVIASPLADRREVDSMERPHGDQVDRIAAAPATTEASTMSRVAIDPIVGAETDVLAPARSG